MPWINVDDYSGFDLSKEEEAELEKSIRAKKPKKMRFYVDEDVPPLAVTILRERGFNVRTVQEAKVDGHPDENHLAEAKKQGRILITCDNDFLDDRKYPLLGCPTLVQCDFGSRTRDEINDTFDCSFLSIEWAPDLFTNSVKIAAKPSHWTEKIRYQEGYSERRKFRIHQGVRQIWVEAHVPH